MTFEPRKRFVYDAIACFFIGVVPLVLLIYFEAKKTSGLEIALLAALFVLPLGIFTYVAVTQCLFYGKRIALSADGILFSFLGFHRFCAWDSLAVKAWTTVGVKFPREWILFSIEPLKPYKNASKNAQKAHDYKKDAMCSNQHPLTSFYVVFEKKKLYGNQEAWVVDREPFLSMLESWGVELERIMVPWT